MPILMAPINVDLTVVKVAADEKLKKHLESLGITPNAKVRVLSTSGGSVICMIKDGRLAIDRDMASKIFVA